MITKSWNIVWEMLVMDMGREGASFLWDLHAPRSLFPTFVSLGFNILSIIFSRLQLENYSHAKKLRWSDDWKFFYYGGEVYAGIN